MTYESIEEAKLWPLYRNNKGQLKNRFDRSVYQMFKQRNWWRVTVVFQPEGWEEE